MKRTPLKSNPEKTRAFIQRNRKPMERGNGQLKRTRLKPVSDKQKARNREWAVVAREHKKAHPFCARCLSFNRQVPVQETHHLDGKEGEKLTDDSRLISVCIPCHRWIHDNSAAARLAGFLGSKHVKIRGTLEAD